MTTARRFPNDANAAKAARQFALTTLVGYPRELLEVVELLVSELATNAVRHTASTFELRISSNADRVRISVTDHGVGAPAVKHVSPTSVSGRGLALVEMLSSSWGVSPSRSLAGGKTVWFVLEGEAHGLRRVRAAARNRRGRHFSSDKNRNTLRPYPQPGTPRPCRTVSFSRRSGVVRSRRSST
jgi:anti-sigma regulatory factor (Ser/Thr protein kinase)